MLPERTIPGLARPIVLGIHSAVALAVGLGGAIGSGLRHGVDLWLAPLLSILPEPGFEATFFVNATGSLLIGIIAVLTDRRGPWGGGPVFRAFLITGLLGGYTTASLFSLEVLGLIQAGEVGMAGLYVFLSFSICLIAVWLGYAVTWPLIHRRSLRRRAAIRRAAIRSAANREEGRR